MNIKKLIMLIAAAALSCATPAVSLAHDTWVQTNTPVTRPGRAVHVDLMLGNHHNNHRDFRLLGKINPQHVTLHALHPNGQSIDLKPSLTDFGGDARTGYWTAIFKPQQPGLHLIAHTSDQVVHYAPLRSIKSAKTFLIVSTDLNNPQSDQPGYDKPLGHPLELVPMTHAVSGLALGKPFEIKLLFHGKPLKDTVVSFIPRGVTLKENFDETYERKTDDQGKVTFTATKANYYLIVAHHKDDTAKGQGYEGTKYSATIIVQVIQDSPSGDENCCE